MKEVFEQYGGMIITAVAIFAVIAVVTVVIGNGHDGYMGQAFDELIRSFVTRVNPSFRFNGTPATPGGVLIAGMRQLMALI